MQAGERYVYKFVCDPEALFTMAFPDNQRLVLKTKPGPQAIKAEFYHTNVNIGANGLLSPSNQGNLATVAMATARDQPLALTTSNNHNSTGSGHHSNNQSIHHQGNTARIATSSNSLATTAQAVRIYTATVVRESKAPAFNTEAGSLLAPLRIPLEEARCLAQPATTLPVIIPTHTTLLKMASITLTRSSSPQRRTATTQVSTATNWSIPAPPQP